MVMTHSKFKEQKKIKIPVKEDDKRRLFMTKAQAVEANRKLTEDRLAREKFAVEQKRNRLEENSKEKEIETEAEQQEEAKEKAREEERKVEKGKIREAIKVLEERLNKEGGPGSRIRKENIQTEIDDLMLQV